MDEKAANELKKRTLTNLYNAKPQWLQDAHRTLDDAVAAAYGWEADIPEDEVLARLLALNLDRISGQDRSPVERRGRFEGPGGAAILAPCVAPLLAKPCHSA